MLAAIWKGIKDVAKVQKYFHVFVKMSIICRIFAVPKSDGD